MNKYVILRSTVLSFIFLVMLLDCGLQKKDLDSKFLINHSLITFLKSADCSEIPDLPQANYHQIDNTHFFAEPHDLFYLMEEQKITIASKKEENLEKAPSVVTVITAEEIEKYGARTLADILLIVPGIDILKDHLIGVISISSRGIQRSSEKIKLLIDGHSMNCPTSGSAMEFFDDLTLTNVKKIEIIRGPGSALYGANAFLAVINVITKDASDIKGVEVKSGFGSFDTQEYNILYGKTFNGLDVTGSVDFYNTNGISETIKEDAISGQPFFNRFSITPGNTDDGRKRFDINMKLSYKNFELKGKYMEKDTEPFIGPLSALTNDSETSYNYVMGELGYNFNLKEMFDFRAKLYYDQYDINAFNEALPDNFTVPADLDNDGDIEHFPDGMIGNGKWTNRRVGSEIEMNYDISNDNFFTVGFNFEWEIQHNINSITNFDPLTGASIGDLQNISDTSNLFRETTRRIWGIYLQDKWNITDDINLTLGIRHDHYSDFEGTTNPRIGLVWEFIDNAALKLLYGEAFRAPSFAELYIINNASFLGNTSLDPETIRTYEIELDYRWSDKIKTKINYFYNSIKDEIGFEQKTTSNEPLFFNNLGGSNVQGIEFDIRGDLSNFLKDTYVFANYSYQDAESNGDHIPDIPKHKGNIGFNVKVADYINANLHTFVSGKRVRAEEDTRDDSPGYAIVNLTLIAEKFFRDFKVKASLFNILNKDYNDPSPINTIPTDIPRPGRTFFLEIGYRF